ncbi:rRNA pseudouridine synthase [Paenibacillus pasadenensis]|uniref:pseudouridine synthase n=1 Tax=Paenibacillus pasadenensis TaxID=217090 RepID=UPI00204011EB|nr:pseudouridine synthase [Paenibacillus pasadenensis]MCM3747159.1 rRNA pseudouridine synthase [Paenibacillus pasadenensis]
MSKKIRLDKLLSTMGRGSRSEIKKAVKAGRVTVDGKPEKDSGRIVDPDQHIVAMDGAPVRYRDKIYIMLHKPPGVISATEDTRERTVIDLLSPEDRVLEPFPVGRLDKDTEGLLLLTNDGQLAHELLSPRKHVPKTYEAIVRGPEPVGEWEKERFLQGVELDDGYVTLPAELEVISWERAEPAETAESGKELNAEGGQEAAEQAAPIVSKIRLTIHEGKFHQVKRMFQSVGGRVVYLKRVSMGPLALDEQLPIGSYRELTEEEMRLLQPEALKEARTGGKE